jgi:hypothetical protein
MGYLRARRILQPWKGVKIANEMTFIVICNGPSCDVQTQFFRLIAPP